MMEWWNSLWSVTGIHWLVFCLVLLALAVLTQIFDFLWLALAAGIVVMLLYFSPDSSLTMQNGIFFISAVSLVVLGRIWGKRLNAVGSTHPDLNDRSAQMIGQRGAAVGNFRNGVGCIKSGDSQWRARCEGTELEDITDGMELEIIRTDGTILIVRPNPGKRGSRGLT